MKNNLATLCEISIFTSLLCVCAWITIPFAIPFTLQTFAVFSVCLILGAQKAAYCIITYITLGILGLPVFSNFSFGIGTVFGATGGYILGFIFMTAIYGITVKLFGNGDSAKICGCIAGMLICYFFGTAWYCFLYSDATSSFFEIFGVCAVPFLIPDSVKLLLAFYVYKRLKKARIIY